MLEALFKGFEDYAVDKRGDVGSWVRQEAMVQILRFLRLILDTQDIKVIESVGADKAEFFERYICVNIQQLNEKIDRIREEAGKSLQKFFKYCVPRVPVNFSMRTELECLFVSHEGLTKHEKEFQEKTGLKVQGEEDFEIRYMPWRNAEFLFNSIKPFFDSDTYSLATFTGLVQSSGCLTESTMKASRTVLFEYLSEMQKIVGADGKPDKAACLAKKRKFIKKLCTLYEQNLKVDRVTVPLMKTVENLLQTDYLSDEDLQVDLHEIHKLSVAECSKSKNITKLMAGVGVFSGLLQSSDVELAKKGIKTLLFLLYHNFPKIRATAAQSLYTGLMQIESYDDVMPGGEEAYEEFEVMITETEWDSDVKKLTAETKDKMYAFFGHTPKAPTKKAAE